MAKQNDNVNPGNNEEGSPPTKRRKIEELLEKQKNLEKSHLEMGEKLRLAEEEIKKISQELEEDTVEENMTKQTTSSLQNSVTSPGVFHESTAQPWAMSRKCFVLKHVFTDVPDMNHGECYYGKEEEHFGVAWQAYLWKQDNKLNLYLECVKLLSGEKWLISSNAVFKLASKNGKFQSELISGTHGNADGNTKFVSYGASEFIEWNRVKEDFLEDGKLTVEIHVEIEKMIGIYKNDLISFDDEMKPFSDVVLVVNEKKFFVSKLHLAGRSPYFNLLLMRNFQKSTKSEIKLIGIVADDFQNYLEVLYGEQSIDECTVEGILVVADTYDTPMVIRKCEDFLVKKSQKTLKKMLEMSIRYNLEALKKKCLGKIKSIVDIKSVVPGHIHDMDASIMATLL
ncbi:hypothetical protein GCK72_016254 [Caenorhabditis remanei]|uniref:BTB domain-containing protein n=1 Tax=Caenorhabditis remanei TaxID=31234 RepID=A0A6A5GXA8_CAERE|nr:hypothetical protein GCK72_016254 [Caenorhabditis remanei]KAF1759787.1 hypothetical protein GCK72_016254 [Caenorhabditis remanei]